MLDFIVIILMILFTGKMLITPTHEMIQKYPKIPSPIVAKIGAGIAFVLGMGLAVLQILMWMGKL
ncbi:hypothetical protein [Clostridium sp. HBUAS56010]|uniref:hypothetical protein n=1 Tax=Clostridium sp. HBUAS56010 TaxID=2571127 RepID=UPI0011782371|nr:hypothetical protein [Clostridium sp. HBUAS56010]